MLSEIQILEYKEILKILIYKVRMSLERGRGMYELVFHYYTDSDINNSKTYPTNSSRFFQSFNFDKTKEQIKKRILTNKNDYWKLDSSKIKDLENFCINNPNEFDDLYKNYINHLWKCTLDSLEEEFNKKEQEEKDKNESELKIILKDKYELYNNVVKLILEDTKEYPYKSDKIKVLLDLELDVETIFSILQTKNKKWFSPMSYISKYAEERKEKIKQKKIPVYELNSTIKFLSNKLKNCCIN